MALEDRNGVLHGKYELGRVLGHGNFAKVYHARNLQTDKSVAMKVVGKEKVIKVGMTEQVKREISVMNMVRHPNIVELHEVIASKSKIYFAMELVRGGELFAKVSRGKLREETAKNYFHQLISAVDFCHSRGVYHRDLKPENLLLSEDGNLKVTDFGLSAFTEHLRQDGLLQTRCATPAYVAPEVIGKKGYDGAKADIWSCGVILFVLLAGFLPFQDNNIMKAILRKAMDEDEGCMWKGKKEENMNAFHIIPLSEGFDLSPLFEEKKRAEEEIRLTMTRPASSVVAKLKEVAEATKFREERSGGCLRLKGSENGRKGKLGITADGFPVTLLLVVVEVTKSSSDTLEHNQFCRAKLRPVLKDIVWTSLPASAPLT
ncbi:hypothetical protein RJ640_012602 [Escallonia rubra]|uniref:non-specific serine/threonine protein kinase n=1 Tax=Escallonia rubra TaxID=112253 RepID=A0AA88U6T1_9ASTE|nr:hypothetical protein RJ640_012602 [Escallonia rubra]